MYDDFKLKNNVLYTNISVHLVSVLCSSQEFSKIECCKQPCRRKTKSSMSKRNKSYNKNPLQRQTAVSAYLKSQQLLLFAFARQISR